MTTLLNGMGKLGIKIIECSELLFQILGTAMVATGKNVKYLCIKLMKHL